MTYLGQYDDWKTATSAAKRVDYIDILSDYQVEQLIEVYEEALKEREYADAYDEGEMVSLDDYGIEVMSDGLTPPAPSYE